MSEPRLNPDDLQVETFETLAPLPGTERPPTGMNTYEPGCTTPDLCPLQPYAVPVPGQERPPAGMKTMEPGCTTPELCPLSA